MKTLTLIFTLCFLVACGQNTPVIKKDTSLKESNQLDTAYFAAGCFWCVEAIFESIEGVEKVVSGYSGGSTKNPTYEQVCTGRTGHAETVMIIYDCKAAPYDSLLSVFFNSHDPSTLNSQGPDFGTQYRSAIFYSNEVEKQRAHQFIDSLLKHNVFPKITTELKPLEVFWEAEIYHQDFEKNNPNNPYILRISIPRFDRFKKKFNGKLKSENSH